MPGSETESGSACTARPLFVSWGDTLGSENGCIGLVVLSEWVFFLVRNLDARTFEKIWDDARSQNRSIAAVMREILCSHYELDCPPDEKTSRVEYGSRTQRLRMHAVLWQAIKDDSAQTGIPMSVLVREALEANYTEAVT